VKIKVLGSGTSSGVPVITCNCEICTSTNPKNNRMRSSILIDLENETEDARFIVIDTGPDFREQAIKYKIPRVDGVLYTHSHADHIFGLDDIRIYNFRQKRDIPIYANKTTANDLLRIFAYCFKKDPNYQGGGIPSLKLNEIISNQIFDFGSEQILPLKIYHGRLEIIGYRIRNFAYLTDCNKVPEEALNLLEGIETLIVSGLRERPHGTHFNFKEAIEFGNKTTASQIYLTHLSHEVEHEKSEQILKDLKINSKKDFKLCFDGLELLL
jgi:phosphoribosyl 1,2-cyclic phosphate phosphodiesterase